VVSSSSSTAPINNNNGTSNSGGGSSLSGGDIAGIVIGSVVGALLLLGLCIFILLSANNGRKTSDKGADSEASRVQGASVVAPNEVSRTTGTMPATHYPVMVDGVEMQPVHTDTEAQEV